MSKHQQTSFRFTAEDFSPTLLAGNAFLAAQIANAKLQEFQSEYEKLKAELAALKDKIEQAPKVEGYIHADGYILMDRPGDMTIPNECPSKRYAARLVDIVPIKEEEK